MIISKPKFWDKKKGFLSTLLYPLSLIFQIVLFLKKKISNPRNFKIPVICIGNIYIGGTGKTPTSIFIAKELYKHGKKPIIIKKFYKDHFDEHCLIKQHFENLILPKNRADGVFKAISKGFNTIILDDGFQDFSIHKNFNIICFNQAQYLGNGLIFPAGPLRQKLSSLKDADIVLINGKKDKVFEKKVLKINKRIEFFYSNFKPNNINNFKNKKLFAIAGIGNPDNFFSTLQKYGCVIEKKLSFPDHYKFNRSEISNIVDYGLKNNLKIVTTEKDYFRIKKFDFSQIEYLKIDLEINEKEKFLKKILKLYD